MKKDKKIFLKELKTGLSKRNKVIPSKFQQSYKDIEDEKFQEVIDYIEFLKKNPS